MLAPLVALALTLPQAQTTVTRDRYGVPRIQAPTLEAAVEAQGREVAKDRLWQMENSRRLAQGQMAEVFGASYVASDTEYAKTGYSKTEIQAQVDSLSPEAKALMESYARGVNAGIAELKTSGKLPEGYAKNGFEPRPWTVIDSAAITIRLFQQFGQGGAGELRNMALLLYLQARPNKAQALDIFDDFLWKNELRSPTTISKVDDALAGSSTIPSAFWDRKLTEGHLAMLPKVTLGELLPAIRIASRDSQALVAEHHSVPYKMGSYAIVVSGSRSKSGSAMLLSAPQMGHTTPSIIHETCLVGFAAGMDVPGMPGVAIGHTPHLAWALTSGVADTIDIFFNKTIGESNYSWGGQTLPMDKITHRILVKGGSPVEVIQWRTRLGPVIARSNSAGVVFSQKASHWMRELQSYESLVGCMGAKSVADLKAPLQKASVSFNFHYAFKSGEIGYRYLAGVPIRSDKGDPRFPMPGEPSFDWKGMVPYEKMPHMANPKSGLITNWNNKPASWWANSDTPVWGRTFRVETLRSSIPDGKLTFRDVELAAWWIARMDADWVQLGPIVRRALAKETRNDTPFQMLMAYDGLKTDGSPEAALVTEFLDALRTEIFNATTGNFLSPATFRTVTQMHVILEALEGKTKVNYLGKRSAREVLLAALDRAVQKLAKDEPNPWGWAYRAPGIPIPGQAPIPYSDRGSYIQILNLSRNESIRGRSVSSPGIAESGDHAFDQAPLARAWTYKPIQSLDR